MNLENVNQKCSICCNKSVNFNELNRLIMRMYLFINKKPGIFVRSIIHQLAQSGPHCH